MAVSGGADSACLLAAVAQWPSRDSPCGAAATPRAPRRGAAHRERIADSGGACRSRIAAGGRSSCARPAPRCARASRIPLCVVPVAVETGGGVSIEAAARDARYLGLARNLRPGECLLTAHHAQDQAETLLLQLLRGAGLAGLSAMPVCRPFGGGLASAPAARSGAAGVCASSAKPTASPARDDPMNRDPRFDRAYLRSQLWPLIERRWPGAATVLSRTARHLAEARQLLDRGGRGAGCVGCGTARRCRSPACARWRRSSRSIRCANGCARRRITPPPTPRLDRGLEAGIRGRPGSAAGDRVGRACPAPLSRAPVRHRGRGARARRAARMAARAADRALELGSGLGRLHWAPQLGGLDAGRLPRTLERAAAPRRRGLESRRCAPRRKACSTFVNPRACCRGCAMRCPLSTRAMR